MPVKPKSTYQKLKDTIRKGYGQSHHNRMTAKRAAKAGAKLGAVDRRAELAKVRASNSANKKTGVTLTASEKNRLGKKLPKRTDTNQQAGEKVQSMYKGISKFGKRKK